MLYDRWRQISQQHPDEVALRDFATGQQWTFAGLGAEAERAAPRAGAVRFPQGNSAAFILEVLRAWRENRIVCPLEPGQSRPIDPANGDAEMLAGRGIVHLKTTSGTSGMPRCVAMTAPQLAADAENIVATMGLRPDWPNLGAISLAHSYGFSNLVTPLLLHGIPLIIVSAPLPETVRRAAALAEDITLAAVPAMWRAWQMADAIPPNTRLAISASAPLPLELESEVFSRRGLKIHNFYGASECGGIAYDAEPTPRTDASCAGAPMRNVALSIAGDGCLEVRSRAVAETYWPQGSDVLGCGCFHTSDLAELKDGRVFLRGRAGDQINVAGRKVAPEFVERVLLQHPAVRECVVFGVPSGDAERLEEVVAVVVAELKEAELREFALRTLPAWQTPRHWLFVDALQTNPRGKVSRPVWRERWLAAKV